MKKSTAAMRLVNLGITYSKSLVGRAKATAKAKAKAKAKERTNQKQKIPSRVVLLVPNSPIYPSSHWHQLSQRCQTEEPIISSIGIFQNIFWTLFTRINRNWIQWKKKIDFKTNVLFRNKPGGHVFGEMYIGQPIMGSVYQKQHISSANRYQTYWANKAHWQMIIYELQQELFSL